jgi:hypothetical protein
MTLVPAALIILIAATSKNESGRTLRIEPMDSPAPAGSIVPQASVTARGDIILSWQEPLERGGYRFRMSIRHGDQWNAIRTIAQGSDLSMFSADLPGVVEMPNGKLLAYWELKDTGHGDKYATAIQIATSPNEGKTWTTPSRPYRDVPSGQHSFISAFSVGKELGLVWLDAQQRTYAPPMEGHMHGGGAIGLRYVSVDGRGNLTADAFVDPIACECCPTSAAVTRRGPVVVYRDREEAPGTKPAQVDSARPTVRDIYTSRLENGKWTSPRRVFADNWVIDACPDNGPAVDSRGDQIAVAWWTRAGDQPKVQLAFSSDAGDTFGRPIRIDQKAGEGQVTVAWLPGRDAAVVGWLENQQVWARPVDVNGQVGVPIALGSSPRHARLPRWIARNRDIIAAFTRQDHSVQVVRITPQPPQPDVANR